MSNCAICFDELNISDGNFLKLKCKHEFHFSCIFQLMATKSNYNDKCPMCRDELIGEKIKVTIKSNQDQDLLNYMNHQINILENLNVKLCIFAGLLLGLVVSYNCFFFFFHPHIFFGFFNLIKYFLFSISNLIGYFITEIFNCIFNCYVWTWLKIGNYILSFLVLGIFVILQSNGNIPLLVR